MKPICVPCKRFYHCEKQGIFFEEGMPTNREATEWQSYKLWAGDLYKCRVCGHEIIVGVARAPIAEHYMHDYVEKTQSYPPEFRVDDC